jgi:hypothetical protein
MEELLVRTKDVLKYEVESMKKGNVENRLRKYYIKLVA